jgi:sulfopyruvate decarboxylase subunit alpha
MSDIDPSFAVYCGLKNCGIDFIASVPCVNLKKLLCLVDANPNITHIPVTREEEGIGLCAGAWIGGSSPTLLMQNSGLGNCINALASLDFLYNVPLLMIMSHRGSVGETIVGQIPMGKLTPKLLDVMEIPYFSPNPANAEETISLAWNIAKENRRPVAVLLDLNFWRTS